MKSFPKMQRSMTKITSLFSENGSYWASELVSHCMPSALWRRLLLLLMAVAWSIAPGASPLFAQNIQHTENKPDLALRSDIRVDPSTLGMSFSIPLASYPGRAGHGLPVAITYSSKVLRLDFQGVDSTPITGAKTWTGVEFAEHSTAGWTSTLTPPRVEFTGMGQLFNGQGRAACPDVCVPGQTSVGDHYIKRIHVHMPDGSSHELRLDDQTYLFPVEPFTGTFQAVDGSRMRFESNAGAASVLYLPDGSRYLFGPYNNGNELTATHFIDRNGNTLTYNASTRQWTDTLNRVITNPLPANPAANTETTFLAKLVGGTDATYTLRWKNLADVLTPDPATGQPPPLRYPGDVKCAHNSYQNVSPSLFTSSFDTKVCVEQDQSGNPMPFNPVVLYEIVLPTGKFYRFTYTVYGEIDKILLTTGATDRFRYDPVATLSSSTAPYSQTNRGVIERRVSATGSGTDESLWTYSVISSNPYTVRTTRPDLSYSERLLHRSRYTGIGENFARFEFDDARMGMAYEERSYDSSGLMLRRELSKWVEGGPTPGGYSEAARDPKVTKQVSILLDGAGSNALTATKVNRYEQASQPLNLTSSTHYGYDNSMSKTTAQTASVDSFNPADSLAIRTTETAYLDNPDYNARNLVSLPISVTIKTGMPVSGQVKARSETLYDELAPLPCGATVGWTDPGTAPRANVTKVKSWLSTLGAVTDTNAYLSTRTQYDQCGSVRKIWDARDTALSNPTQIEYSHQFSYPTSNTSPDPDGSGPLVSLTTSTEYDVSTGLVTATIDANGQRTTFSYNDPLNRLRQVVRAADDPVAKNQSTYSYDDSARTITVTSDLITYGDNLLKTVTVYDGLGRATETRTFEGGTNYIASLQEYDTLGRVFRTSNPFRPWQSETPLWSTTQYDALDRVISLTTPDNAVVGTAYRGNQILVTDQSSKQRMSESDALGRLTDVWEITAADTATEAVSFPDHPEVTAGYRTRYSYDPFDDLISVTQRIGATGTIQTRSFVYDSLKRLTSATNPESGTISYQYDNNGNLTQKTDARTVMTTYVYDALNRVTNRNYSDGTPAVTYAYDATGVDNSKGRLTNVSSTVSSYSYNDYDALGRVLGGSQTTDGQAYTLSYQYDLAGNMKSQTYPSGRVVVTEFDSASRVAGVKNQATGTYYAGAVVTDLANRIQYWPHGAIKDMKLGNGLWEHSTFNSRLQSTEIGLGTTQGGVDRVKLNYNYGTTTNNGNLLSQVITVPTIGSATGFTATQSFTYDELNRLETAQENSGSSWTQNFNYDRYGNRNFISGTTLPAPLTAANNPSINLSNNRIDALASGQTNVTYDNAGNLTHDVAGHAFAYDAENKQTTYDGGASVGGGASYFYDGDGRRVKKVLGGSPMTTTVFVYNAASQLVAEYSNATPSGLGGTSYLTSDELGSPRIITGSNTEPNQGVRARHDYLPFGEEIATGPGGRSTAQGYVIDSVRQKFTSYERDNETGLDFAQARYFASAQGRFTSVDPLGASGNTHNPQSFNRYGYVMNNPLNLADPSGMISNDRGGGLFGALSNPWSDIPWNVAGSVSPQGAGVSPQGSGGYLGDGILQPGETPADERKILVSAEDLRFFRARIEATLKNHTCQTFLAELFGEVGASPADILTAFDQTVFYWADTGPYGGAAYMELGKPAASISETFKLEKFTSSDRNAFLISQTTLSFLDETIHNVGRGYSDQVMANALNRILVRKGLDNPQVFKTTQAASIYWHPKLWVVCPAPRK